ncbi:MAG: DUF2726 domain-containing protein [Anaerolineae bacterium]
MIDWTEIFKPLQEEINRNFLYWVAYFVRDLAVIIVALYTAFALFIAILTLLVKKEARLPRNWLAGSFFGVLLGGLSCIPNIDRALFLTQIQAVAGLGLIIIVWSFILLILRPRWISETVSQVDHAPMNTNPEKPGCLARIFPFLQRQSASSQPDAFPYLALQCLLTPAELNFYRVLVTALAHRYCIFVQVPISNLVYPKSGDRKTNNALRQKIVYKRVDFVLCDPATLRPLAAIELDDASHDRPDRIARDAFVDQVFAAAGIPLIHIPASTTYTPADLRALQSALASPPQP